MRIRNIYYSKHKDKLILVPLCITELNIRIMNLNSPGRSEKKKNKKKIW